MTKSQLHKNVTYIKKLGHLISRALESVSKRKNHFVAFTSNLINLRFKLPPWSPQGYLKRLIYIPQTFKKNSAKKFPLPLGQDINMPLNTFRKDRSINVSGRAARLAYFLFILTV